MSDMYSAERSRLAPGTRLNGIYEIDQRIASGGMGEIYRGHTIETGDPVAIKVMRTDLADNAMALALFRKEASALHYIHHEAIVRYYVFSNDPGTGRHYLAMEFVDGLPGTARLCGCPRAAGAPRRRSQCRPPAGHRPPRSLS
jgi:eukaryotic-like serine/threonine-protein kinase